jgi:hypothetical protein
MFWWRIGGANLTTLRISDFSSLSDLTGLSDLPNLTTLTISDCNSLTSLKGLIDLPKLAKKELNEKLEKSYVLENFDLFEGLLDKLEVFKDPSGLPRCIGHRTGRKGSKNEGKSQPMIRLNLLIEDLIEFRARKNLLSEDGEQCNIKTLKVRFSQDVGSLLAHLDKARAKRTHKRSLDKK